MKMSAASSARFRHRSSVLVLFILLVDPMQVLVSAFTVGSLQFCHRTTRSRRKVGRLSLPVGYAYDADSEAPIELWLDLRGTAITPRRVLSKLDEDYSLSPSSVSKVLVSLQDVPRALSFWEQGDPDLLVVDESDDSLCDARDLSVQYGISVTVDGDAFVDPMPAFKATSKGQWLLIDTPEGKDDNIEARQEAISSLVDFISGGVALGDGSLLLDGTNNANGNTNGSKGGIAIACRTKADLVQAANTLHFIETGSLTTTESGILLKVDPAEGSSSSLRLAIVLPFDMALWKASILVMSTEYS